MAGQAPARPSGDAGSAGRRGHFALAIRAGRRIVRANQFDAEALTDFAIEPIAIGARSPIILVNNGEGAADWVLLISVGRPGCPSHQSQSCSVVHCPHFKVELLAAVRPSFGLPVAPRESSV